MGKLLLWLTIEYTHAIHIYIYIKGVLLIFQDFYILSIIILFMVETHPHSLDNTIRLFESETVT